MSDPANPPKLSSDLKQPSSNEDQFRDSMLEAQRTHAGKIKGQTNSAVISATDARIGDVMSPVEHGKDTFNEFFKTVEEMEGLVDLGKLAADLSFGFVRDDINALTDIELPQWLPSEKKGQEKLAVIADAISLFIDELHEDTIAALMPDLSDLKEDHRYPAMVGRLSGHAATFFGLLKLSRMNKAMPGVEGDLALSSSGATNTAKAGGEAASTGAELLHVPEVEVISHGEALYRNARAIDATPRSGQAAYRLESKLASPQGSAKKISVGKEGSSSGMALMPEKTMTGEVSGPLYKSGINYLHPDTIPDGLAWGSTQAYDTIPDSLAPYAAQVPDTIPVDMRTVSTIPPAHEVDLRKISTQPATAINTHESFAPLAAEESGIRAVQALQSVTELPALSESLFDAARNSALSVEDTVKMASQLYNAYNGILSSEASRQFSQVTSDIVGLKKIKLWEEINPAMGQKYTGIFESNSLELMPLARQKPALAEEIRFIMKEELKAYEALRADPTINSHPELTGWLDHEIDQISTDIPELSLLIMENLIE